MLENKNKNKDQQIEQPKIILCQDYQTIQQSKDKNLNNNQENIVTNRLPVSDDSDQGEFQDYCNQKMQFNLDQLITPSIDNQVENMAIISILKQTNPIQSKNIKPDALQYDMKSGWIPKAQVTGPIPVSFSNQIIDQIIQDKMQKMIYLGYRPTNSFQIHKKFYQQGKKYPFYQFHLFKSQFLQRFFKKYYSDMEFTSSRIIEGQIKKQSPTQQTLNLQPQTLIFDSTFEGGNLDAVYVEQNQYRMMVRMDSNTKGHCNYYNFRVKCTKAGTYRMRIMNINKKKSLYERGMKPYVKCLTNNDQWRQRPQCKAVRFGPSFLNEQYESCVGRFYSLKFDFEFQKNKEYQFCYGIPYVYSDLTKLIHQIRQNPNVHVGKLCHTLSGVQIPLITIKDKQKQQYKNKQTDNKNQNYCVVITGRVHPAQTNGSHIVNGLIKSLLQQTKQSKFLRQNVVFKIIPMLNPDGVIVGNTRTSFAGKDLNRKYTDKTEFIFPQVIGVRDYVIKLKQKYGEKLLFIVDVHGHSNRKGSFFFGPQYSIMSEEYSKCRLLPKLYSGRSSVFRYYSCKFRLSSWKQNTSRGYFNNRNIRAYTHQTSMHCFFDFITRADLAFTLKSLQKLGSGLLMSIFDYVFKIKVQKKAFIDKQFAQEIQKQLQTKTEQMKKQTLQVNQERDSDKMSQDKADSQDSKDDIDDKELNVFYEKVNVNRQYFYQELLKQHGNSSLKKDESSDKNNKSKNKNVVQIEDPAKQYKIELETYKAKKRRDRVDWIAKAAYTPKKSLFQQYSKMSSVIMGKKRQTYGRSPQLKGHKLKQLSDRRYSLKNNHLSQKQSLPHIKLSEQHQKLDQQARVETQVLFRTIDNNNNQQPLSRNHSLSLKKHCEATNKLIKKPQLIDRQALFKLIHSKNNVKDQIQKLNLRQGKKVQDGYLKMNAYNGHGHDRSTKTIDFMDRHSKIREKEQFLLKKMQKQYTSINKNVKSLSNVSKLPRIQLLKKQRREEN